MAGCEKRLAAAFSLRSDSQRTARVRLGSSLTAALLDGQFAHPADLLIRDDTRCPVQAMMQQTRFSAIYDVCKGEQRWQP